MSSDAVPASFDLTMVRPPGTFWRVSVGTNMRDPGAGAVTTARWKLPAIIVAVAALLVGLGVGTWLLYRSPPGPLPPPDAPWPTTGSVSVFLCNKGMVQEKCGGRAITATQTREVERVLRNTPEVSEVRFISRAEALAKFKATFARNKELIAATSESDMPQSFRAKVSTLTGDHVRKIEALGGVVDVMTLGTGFWVGKADLGIHLCPQQENEKGTKCSGRGAPTAEEKPAVYEALRSIDSVGPIYFEDHVHAGKDRYWRIFGKPQTKSSDAAPESFYVVLRAPGAVEQVKRGTGNLPGVKEITGASQWE
ncbi:permease-like cell division protein FtsX [Nonomuraea sp. B12E4]|uniref:permease-like cell division protein FtsX n=1 Tax=Nonomuraea sp. B12E4 TaxID=3153564 RepID=UPI00325EB09A